jgi:hypothetical protein
MINTVIWLLAIKTDLGVQVTSWNSFTCDTTSSALTGGSGSSTPTTDALAEKDKAECNKYCTDLGGSETIVNKCVSDCVAKKSEDRKKGSAATGMLSNSEAIEKLKQAGINTTSSTGCVGQDKIGCTTLENMPASAVDNLIALKGACPGISTVTGGTESAGHVSHGSGKPIFDIQADSSLAQCVANNKGNFNITQLCTDGSVSNYNCGNYREKGGVLHIKF